MGDLWGGSTLPTSTRMQLSNTKAALAAINHIVAYLRIFFMKNFNFSFSYI